LKLVINQYKAGTVPYSSVITAQITALTAEKTAADITYLRMVSAVGLVKALGGGWDVGLLQKRKVTTALCNIQSGTLCRTTT
jgi:outer membrane protein TolC